MTKYLASEKESKTSPKPKYLSQSNLQSSSKNHQNLFTSFFQTFCTQTDRPDRYKDITKLAVQHDWLRNMEL